MKILRSSPPVDCLKGFGENPWLHGSAAPCRERESFRSTLRGIQSRRDGEDAISSLRRRAGRVLQGIADLGTGVGSHQNTDLGLVERLSSKKSLSDSQAPPRAKSHLQKRPSRSLTWLGGSCPVRDSTVQQADVAAQDSESDSPSATAASS